MSTTHSSKIKGGGGALQVNVHLMILVSASDDLSLSNISGWACFERHAYPLASLSITECSFHHQLEHLKLQA